MHEAWTTSSSDAPTLSSGRIVGGDEDGRFVEVVDDFAETGGRYIFTYADAQKSPPGFDNWRSNLAEVGALFTAARWTIKWLDERPPST